MAAFRRLRRPDIHATGQPTSGCKYRTGGKKVLQNEIAFWSFCALSEGVSWGRVGGCPVSLVWQEWSFGASMAFLLSRIAAMLALPNRYIGGCKVVVWHQKVPLCGGL